MNLIQDFPLLIPHNEGDVLILTTSAQCLLSKNKSNPSRLVYFFWRFLVYISGELETKMEKMMH